MKHVETLMNNYIKKRDDVKECIEQKFSGLIYNPINSGSYAKSTEINIKFDLDLCVPVKKNSYNTIKEMYDSFYDYFYYEYRKLDKELIEVRKQKTSIGLQFQIGRDKIDMDIVPGRELNVDSYPENNDLNICDSKNNSCIQTNIQEHINLIKGKNSEREIIRLLKIWKYKEQFDIKSFLIELLVIKAFENNQDVTGIWEQLKMTLEFIKDNIKTIKLVDPANSGNIVSKTLTDYEKINLEDKFNRILNSINAYEENIKIFFPENSNYKIKENSYSSLKTNIYG
ncbi:MAG: hypothetical protein A2086_15275 [Spirochaetes bacterium GWD1_27_9]|nr:MAG: hypothetical protein A2Z98_05915 [Spirochaetes bacterium GWB1_27_13]OHD25199.1 MAG: hypothetical protein A2Y34_14995 [Spirochaetes bacterium GWC1_27_15]OHD31265.1 MAG: hypothetical protein A2086_15275 [Spirochaetes bacterium GWD1_27_9]